VGHDGLVWGGLLVERRVLKTGIGGKRWLYKRMADVAWGKIEGYERMKGRTNTSKAF